MYSYQSQGGPGRRRFLPQDSPGGRIEDKLESVRGGDGHGDVRLGQGNQESHGTKLPRKERKYIIPTQSDG